MFSIHHQLARILMEERIAQADQARAVREHRRQQRQSRRAGIVAPTPEAEVIELAFGAQCESDRLGA